MTLTSILLGLLLEHFYDQWHRFRRYDHFHAFVDWVRARLPAAAAGGYELAAVLLPPLFAVALLQGLLDDLLWGLPALAFGVAVLLFCLGPEDIFSEVERYRQALLAGDEEGRKEAATAILGCAPPGDSDEEAARVTEAVLAGANGRIFGVLFWFVLLGPLGAVGYRAVKELERNLLPGDDAFAQWVWRLEAVLDWLPARLLAAAYALSGHFDEARARWRNHMAADNAAWDAAGLLAEVGLGAIDGVTRADSQGWADQLHRASRIIWRSLVIWVFLIALATLAEWFS